MVRFSRSHSGFMEHSDSLGTVLPHIIVPLLACILLFTLSINQPRAAEQSTDMPQLGPHEFIIPASDGYGTSECLSQQSNCGKVIADAWCESHGHAHAIGYSKAEDVTGVIKLNTPALKIPREAIIVSCGK